MKNWVSYTFSSELLPLEPYDLQPVTDIPIRLAVEQGVIPRKHDLALYRITQDWQEHPKGSIVLAGPIEAGQPFAIWVGEPEMKKKEVSEKEMDEIEEIVDSEE